MRRFQFALPASEAPGARRAAAASAAVMARPVAAAFCGILGGCGWAFYILALHVDVGQDWMVFYTAARAYLGGNLPLIYDGNHFTAALNLRFAHWLGMPLNLHPWVYPPTFLLLFLPFGLLPPGGSLALFLLASFGALAAVVWYYADRGHPRGFNLVLLVLCPAVPFNVMTGQNAFLTGALLVGGFCGMRRHPLWGGALLGLLTFKPQLWLMVPVALVAARQWRALLATVVTAGILVLCSLAVFGIEPWRVWLEMMTGPSELYRDWLVAGRLNGVSIFACAMLLGASREVANATQAIAIAVAAGCVYRAFRRPAPERLRLPVLLVATMLAAPHASTTDAVLLAVAAIFFLSGPILNGRPAIVTAIALAVWASPLFNPPSLFRIGLTTPVLLVAFLAVIFVAIRDAAAVAPAPLEATAKK